MPAGDTATRGEPRTSAPGALTSTGALNRPVTVPSATVTFSPVPVEADDGSLERGEA